MTNANGQNDGGDTHNTYAATAVAALISVIGAIAIGNSDIFQTAVIWWVVYVIYTGVIVSIPAAGKILTILLSGFAAAFSFTMTLLWWSLQGGLSQISGGPITVSGIAFIAIATMAGVSCAVFGRDVLVSQLESVFDKNRLARIESALTKIAAVLGAFALVIKAFLDATD
jgi:hypothetical protein